MDDTDRHESGRRDLNYELHELTRMFEFDIH
jgi:hypothetical protein